MDENMRYALRRHLKPFDGFTLTVREPLAFPDVADALRSIMTFVKRNWLREPLTIFDDWHEHHNGLCRREATFQLATLKSALLSAETLAALDPGDHDVRLAVYPASMEFLWRFGLAHGIEYHPNHGGWFLGNVWDGKRWHACTEPVWHVDFTSSRTFVEAMKLELGGMRGAFQTKVAKAYFHEIESK